MTQKTAWLVMHKIREGLIGENKAELSGVVEVDETWVGGKRKNKHAKQRRALKGTLDDKYPVAGALERGGDGVTRHVQFVNKDALIPFVDEFVEMGSVVFTDENTTYNTLEYGFKHRTVCHTKGEYVRGNVSTNSMESFWAYLKRTWAGTYHWWSRKYCQRYLNEITGRFNLRRLPVEDRMKEVMLGLEGRLLPARVLAKGCEPVP